MMIAYVFITVLALGGLSLSIYIYRKKRRKETMVCPMGSDCDAVIHSQYAKFLSVPVETLGLIYYGFITLVYVGLTLSLFVGTPIVAIAALVITAFAFLFSLYLIFIQAFVLRQWCTWCLISASICTVMFLIAASSAVLPNVQFFQEIQPLLTPLHIIAIAIGVGAAIIIEVFFLKFLRDYYLSISEADILHTLAEILWIALAVTIVTQVGIYFAITEPPIQVALKNIVIFIIIINGAFLHPLLTPKLLRVSSGETHKHQSGELHRLRKTAFRLSGISVASWLFLVLATLSFRSTSPVALLTLYVVLILSAFVVNSIFDAIFARRRES
jgi:uncharacterized membrane protein